MNKKQKDEIKAIAGLNATSFGSDDDYSSVANILYVLLMEDGEYFVIRDEGEIVGYILIKKKSDGYHCVRRGVTPRAKRRGLGTKLSKKGVKFARAKGQAYRTYMALDNYASMNSNINAGLRIAKIGESWVSMVAD